MARFWRSWPGYRPGLTRVRDRILGSEPSPHRKGKGKGARFSRFARYRRWVTRVMSLSVSDAWVGLGEEMLSGVVLIM